MKMRKCTAIILALVMVFAMSVNALAVTTSTATLQVYYGGEPILDTEPVTIDVTTNMTAKDALDLYGDAIMLEWTQVANLNPNPAFGSTAYVVDTIYGVGSEPVGAASGVTAQFWSSAYPGYGIEFTEIVNGETVYHFIYVGNDWEFTVNGEKPLDPFYTDASGEHYQLYMDQYTIQNGDEIVVNYTQQVERWTDTDNWLAGT